jgi:hypothetical protein
MHVMLKRRPADADAVPRNQVVYRYYTRSYARHYLTRPHGIQYVNASHRDYCYLQIIGHKMPVFLLLARR